MKRNFLPAINVLICFLILSLYASRANAQYCVPSFFFGCNDGFGDIGDDINTFTLTGAAGTSINDLSTGCSAASYDNRTGESVTLSPGGTYSGTINSTSDIEGSGESFQVFIDFNDDSTYSASESVGGLASGIAFDPATSSFTITIPAGAATGTHHMRVILTDIDDASYPAISPCAEESPIIPFPYEYGEVHDYTVVIGTATPPACGVPTGLAASSITTTSAVLSWADPSGSAGSEYVVSTTSGTPTGSGTATTALTETSTGLTPATVYYAYVRDSCGPGDLSAWVTTTFTTTATATTTCNPVSGLAASAITGATATISWTAVPGSAGYVYVVNNTVTAPTGGGGTFTTTASASLTGLTAGTTYYAHVRDSCGAGNESGWVTVPFTTTTTGCNAETALAAGSITSHSAIITWTPAAGAVGAEYVVNTTPADPAASGARTTTATYTATGLTASTLYYAHVRDSCGATSLSAWVTIPFTTLAHGVGVNNITADDFGILAFPNPVKDEVTIQISGTASAMGQVQLFDISGKLIKTVLANANTLSISMGNMPAGIYLIRYIDEAHTQTIKVNKQ